MFIFERVGFEPEMYLEDYSINFSDNGKPFVINDYHDEEGYDMGIIPVVSINRKDGFVELYDFCYAEAKPSDRPMIIKVILQLVDLKNELDINGYRVIGDGANLYAKLYNRSYI